MQSAREQSEAKDRPEPECKKEVTRWFAWLYLSEEENAVFSIPVQYRYILPEAEMNLDVAWRKEIDNGFSLTGLRTDNSTIKAP
jgi:hypothetical protein